jgi:hypothetical protein
LTLEAAPPRLAAVVDRLMTTYDGAATREAAMACVTHAWDAVRYFGATDDESMVTLAERVAERELRLRLGIEREVARLDPEDHHR